MIPLYVRSRIFTFPLGLVDYVSSQGSTAFQRALQLADEMAHSGESRATLLVSVGSLTELLAPLALRAAKAAMSRSLDTPLDIALDHELACYEPLLRTKDRVEALVAFREKREPVFRGE